MTRLFALKQQGLGFYGFSFLIAIAVFVAIIASRIVPIYIDHYYIAGFYKQVSDQSRNEPMTRQQYLEAISRRAQINTLSFDPKPVTKFEGSRVDVVFETRRQLMFNAFIVIEFERSFEWQGR